MTSLPIRIGLMVLAAGGSRRMGKPKQLLPWGSAPLAVQAFRAARDSGCRPWVAVLGDEAEALSPWAAACGGGVAGNPAWRRGLAGSLRIGLEALLAHAPLDAVLVTLADQPRVTGAHLRSLVERYQARRAPVVAACYGGGHGVPALFDRRLFPELAGLRGDSGAKAVIARHAGEACLVDLPEAAWDVDTPEDYRRLLEGQADGADPL